MRARSRRSHFDAALFPAIGVALLLAVAARWLYNVTGVDLLRLALLGGGVAFVLLWSWQRFNSALRRWPLLKRWWREGRGGALIALVVFIVVAALGRYGVEASARESVSWGLWLALPLWLLWYVVSSFELIPAAQRTIRTWWDRTPPRSRSTTLTRSRRTSLQKLSPDQFEALCARIGAGWGYEARTTGKSGDGGVDVELWKEGKYLIGQCKHYYKKPVGPSHIRDFYGTIIHTEADGGFFFTSGYFTSGAVDFAAGKPITLVDREHIQTAIERYG
ncbi:MAG: restriction endonuclease [Anaerolineales bacterium]|nr:restriction endonuclease [Anaerolineales bacterium]MCB9127745.1 restriction endonuclease [Ardenticatenales bacterium]